MLLIVARRDPAPPPRWTEQTGKTLNATVLNLDLLT